MPLTKSLSGQPLVEEYGCVRCQRLRLPHWHRKGIDPEYADHVMWQSKHGPRCRVATPGEVLRLLAAEPTAAPQPS